MFTLMALFAVALQTSSEGHDNSQLMKCAKVCADASHLRRLFQTLPETQRRRQRKARQDAQGYLRRLRRCCKACAMLCA